MNDLNSDENLSDLATLLGSTGDVRHDERWLVYAADARILMTSALGATIVRTLAHLKRWLMAHDEENKRLRATAEQALQEAARCREVIMLIQDKLEEQAVRDER